MNPFNHLLLKRAEASGTQKLYGAIVARARLPIFYREFGVPDTLEGRFAMLSLHLFAVLYRLKGEGPERAAFARSLAQELTDSFAADMDTVLREHGVGDIKVPAKMRKLVGASQAQFAVYDVALGDGQVALAKAIASSLPLDGRRAENVSGRLASYLLDTMHLLRGQPLTGLLQGEPHFPPPDDENE